MRLAVCALSAVLLSGCSWLGMGGQGSAGGAYGINCAPSGTGFYNASGACGVGGGYGVAGYGNGYGAGGVYGAGYGTGAGYGAGAGFGTGAGYGAGYGTGYGAGYGTGAGFGAGTAGYGAGQGFGAGYGAGTGFGAAGAGAGLVGAGLAANGVGFGTQGYGVNGFGGAYGANGAVTTLGTNAAFGSAVAGQNVVGTQFSGGQFVQGAGVQTIQGAPIYVPQPYPAYYGVPQLRGFGGGAALPFGFELDGGTDFGIGGDVFTEKPAGPADKDESTGIRVSEIDAIGYDEAFGDAKSIGGTFGYDVSRNTTLLGRLGYSSAEGQTIDNYATVQEGTYTAGVHDPGTNPERAIDLTFSDLEQFSVEGGVRQYVGGGHAFRPYVGASAGFIHNNSVDIVQTYADGNAAPTGSVIYNEQEYIDSGWSPTAAATLGAEVAVGPRAAIGVESGIRWSDKLDTNLDSESRWSVPLKLRGRVAF